MPRKVILGFGISIDGYIARRNGALDFLVMDKEGEAVMADFFANIDATIMGRKTAAGWVKMRKSGEIPDMPRHGQLRCFAALEAGQTRGI
jgi:dihydrofolate reductase